jgi:catechol 2,3-dioxygenase-like lactoylglutathione lyase family enzyme
MLIEGAHHFSLAVADIEEARGFYSGLLGLPEIERPDFGLPGIWYQAGPVQLHLIQTPEGVDVGSQAPALTPLAQHVAFEISDYEAMHAQLEAAGVAMLSTGADVGQIFVRDPDGNTLEFIKPGGRLGRR